jgi:hypothetical protein
LTPRTWWRSQARKPPDALVARPSPTAFHPNRTTTTESKLDGVRIREGSGQGEERKTKGNAGSTGRENTSGNLASITAEKSLQVPSSGSPVARETTATENYSYSYLGFIPDTN